MNNLREVPVGGTAKAVRLAMGLPTVMSCAPNIFLNFSMKNNISDK